jgi:sugar/nucleoside kinase (ribokinase family)
MKILVAGEICADLILQDYERLPEIGKEVLVRDSDLVLGSASAICAAGLTKLGEQVAFMGKVGCDFWGDFCLSAMKAERIDVSHVIRDPTLKTGLTVSLTNAADRALITHLGAMTYLTADDITDGMMAGHRHIHISSFYLQEGLRSGGARVFERAHRAGLTCSLDPGCDPSGRWRDDIFEAFNHIDVFLPNEMELSAITGLSDPEGGLRAIAGAGPLTVVKLGRRGCMALREGKIVHVPAFSVEPKDTTGAGDSFNAGFLHRWLHASPMDEALHFAAACGALSTLKLGGTANQPNHEQVRRFDDEHVDRNR